MGMFGGGDKPVTRFTSGTAKQGLPLKQELEARIERLSLQEPSLYAQLFAIADNADNYLGRFGTVVGVPALELPPEARALGVVQPVFLYSADRGGDSVARHLVYAFENRLKLHHYRTDK
jgi:hypothetical protein